MRARTLVLPPLHAIRRIVPPLRRAPSSCSKNRQNPRARRTTEFPDYDVRLFLSLYSTISLSSPTHTSSTATPYIPHRERNEKRKPHLNLLTLNRCAPCDSRIGVLVGLAGVHPPSSRSLSLPHSLSITVCSGSWWSLSSLRRPPVALSRTPVCPSYCPLPCTHRFGPAKMHARTRLAEPHTTRALITRSLSHLTLYTRRNTP